MTETVAGLASGRVMFQNRCQAVAPSTLAASKYSRGDGQDAGHEDDRGQPHALPDVDERDREQRPLRVHQPAGSGDADDPRALLIAPSAGASAPGT